MREKIDPPPLSLKSQLISAPYLNPPRVEPTIWIGVFWGIAFTMAICVVVGFIIRTIWS